MYKKNYLRLVEVGVWRIMAKHVEFLFGVIKHLCNDYTPNTLCITNLNALDRLTIYMFYLNKSVF